MGGNGGSEDAVIGVPASAAEKAAAEVVPRATARQWLGLAMLLLGTFVAQVDFFIVNVALPSMQRDLTATLAEVQLIATGYGGAFAIAVVTGGRLGDLFGRRRVFIAGLAGFALASLAAGAAPAAPVLVAARIVQGLAAALILPQGIGSLHAMFSGQDRERAFAVFGVTMGLAWVSGLVLGGLIIGADVAGLGWRVIFLINLPLAAVAVAGTLAWVAESRPPTSTDLDVAGLAALAALVALVLFPLIQGRQAGWPWWTYACLGLAAVAGAAVVGVEHREARRGRLPIISPDLFRDDNFRLGLLVIVVFFSAPAGFFLMWTLYLQNVVGFSALQSGLSLLPFGVVFVASSELVKQLKARIGEAVIVLGVALMMVAIAALALTVRGLGTTVSVAQLAPGVGLLGLGQALVTIPLYEMLLRTVRREIAATATGVFTTVQVVAQALAVAVVIIIFAALVGQQVSAALPARAAALEASLAASGLPAPDVQRAVAAYRTCAPAAGSALADGARLSCAAPADSRAAVDRAAVRTVAAAAQQAFALTLVYNLLTLIGSAIIMAVHMRRSRAGQPVMAPTR